ncbi:bifunctional demethylmenaquinone methyltransferase/2-methoxy-6-polyprenyl-1,4-benzoquinol methylase UbiE [Blattabacterium sp. (Blaberus giganteus)]|uniref:bifunctional demethylmenaquinone methyltransferase/2-methoxy-6-polyprenyl-1,4-benzoquinol methylase UbiE n=1 Tax=Blattabacterium sp. (Blaberus giganteus) TaxID=1186051 RepID=UPI00025F700C|nr:bifunctional demethylmenaquinone methyltransferase/2-methoxy-6-polyprenyl-1,4-benzoquinol methylase UbiE [Blattabacterium sp. (Blaberus giganteus)]AFJ90945.1 ubiquinone/menaquinone biosynthesis methyltransferase [Blattabacterium sp. (Blaberus giganteus)]
MKKDSDSLYSKEKKLKNMFDHIAHKYDLINRILSFGIDLIWRKKTIHLLCKFNKKKVQKILDLATGTGDIAILLANKFKHAFITGLDPSDKMIKIAKQKIKNNFFEKRVQIIQGYSQNIPFQNETFDIVTIAFGIRNFQYIHDSVREIYRILKPSGILVILEFSKPSNYWIKKIYYFYFHLVKKIGNFISKNHFAYNYLKESILSFPYCNRKMNKLLKYHKFDTIHIQKLTFGIVSLYFFKKKNDKIHFYNI